MTSQIPDILTYNNAEYNLNYLPLDAYFAPYEPPFSGSATNCWRGYRASWRIDQETLYLVDLESDGKSGLEVVNAIFPASGEAVAVRKDTYWLPDYYNNRRYEKNSDGWVKAKWFTGELAMQQRNGSGLLVVFHYGQLFLEEFISPDGYVVESRLTEPISFVIQVFLVDLMNRNQIWKKAQGRPNPGNALHEAVQKELQFIKAIRLDLDDPNPKLDYANWLEAQEDLLSRQYLLRAEVERWRKEGNRRDYNLHYRQHVVPSGAVDPNDAMWFWRKLVGFSW